MRPLFAEKGERPGYIAFNKDAMMTILTQDVDEGTRAVVEKRSPVWQGRCRTDWHCVSEAGKSYCLPKW